MIGPLRTRRDELRRASNVVRSVIRHGPPGDIASPTGSRRQPVSALPPPGLDDRSAGTCRHTVTKPMIFGPLAVVRLERALHPGLLCAHPRRPGQAGRLGLPSSIRSPAPDPLPDGPGPAPNRPASTPINVRQNHLAPASSDGARLPVLRCLFRRNRPAMSGSALLPQGPAPSSAAGSTEGERLTRLIHSCGSPCGDRVTGRRKSW